MKYLAYIWPNEDFTNKTECSCSVLFASGNLDRQLRTYVLTTNIFRYSYWGVTFEVIDLDEKGNIVDIHDIYAEDMKDFKLGIAYVLTYDNETHRVICSDGVAYDLSNNIFHNRCKAVCDYMISEIGTAINFVAYVYTTMQGIVYISFDKNLSEKDKRYKCAVHRGFITRNEKVLRTMTPSITSKSDSSKLSQEEIDKMLEDMGLGK